MEKTGGHALARGQFFHAPAIPKVANAGFVHEGEPQAGQTCDHAVRLVLVLRLEVKRHIVVRLADKDDLLPEHVGNSSLIEHVRVLGGEVTDDDG